jgi:hypothetical protein
MASISLRGLCKALAGLAIGAGVIGILEPKLGAAGAILIGSGLISLSLLASSEPRLLTPREKLEENIMKRDL